MDNFEEKLKISSQEFGNFINLLKDSCEYSFEDEEEAFKFFTPTSIKEVSPEIFQFNTDSIEQVDRDITLPCILKSIYSGGDWNDNGGGSGEEIGLGKNILVRMYVDSPDYCDDECDATASFTIYFSPNEELLTKFGFQLADEEKILKLRNSLYDVTQWSKEIQPQTAAKEIMSYLKENTSEELLTFLKEELVQKLEANPSKSKFNC